VWEKLDEDYMTTSETARALGVTTVRVLQLEGEGRLVAHKTRLGRFFERESVERLLDRRAGKPEDTDGSD
jgi:hypothetical protein